MNVSMMMLALAAVSAGDFESARVAVNRALPLIQKSVLEYPKHRDCFSCHHQAIPILSMTIARERGFEIDPEAIGAAVDLAHDDLEGAIDAYKKGEGQPGGVTRAGYALFTLERAERGADSVTEAVAGFLVGRDAGRGYWNTSSTRPPSEASSFTTTYLALRGVSAFGGKADGERIAARVDKARRWLISAQPRDTEDRVFRLLALRAASAPSEVVASASGALRATQRQDGGWSQRDGDQSDAYATGSALVALALAGDMSTEDDSYQRGLRFLVATQRDDGSWFVKSRSKPFQTYFESGFPHGKDQFISMAGSSWAVAALALSFPKR